MSVTYLPFNTVKSPHILKLNARGLRSPYSAPLSDPKCYQYTPVGLETARFIIQSSLAAGHYSIAGRLYNMEDFYAECAVNIGDIANTNKGCFFLARDGWFQIYKELHCNYG